MNTQNLMRCAIVLALALGLAGCGSSDDDPDDGRVVFVNAMDEPSNTPVTLVANGVNVATNIAGNTVAAGSFESPAGSQGFQVVNATTGGTILGVTPVTIQPSIDQLVVLTGTPGSYQLTNLGRIDLDSSNTALTGNSRVYFVNAADATAGGVDFGVVVQGNATQPQFPASTQDILIRQLTNEQLIGVGTGPATFSATVGGTTVSSAPVNLEGTKTYVVVLFPNSAGTGNELRVFKLN